ncbi:MAG: NCS2 family permease [Nitriliruptoraceae bacterium]
MADNPQTATSDAKPSDGFLERYFELRKHGSTIRTEVVAGSTTFLAMAYILFVNPAILSATGMDEGAVFVATALAAAIGTIIMGLWAKYPIAQAPGMGLNAFFAFTVVIGMGVPWETALAATFVSGFLFFLLAITGVREAIINAIPMELKLAVGAGIGLFIAFIGLQNSELIVGYEPTLITLGDIGSPTSLLTIFGLLVTALLLLRGIKGGVFYGIIVTSIVGMIFGLVGTPDAVVSAPPSLAPTFGQAFANLPELLTAQMALVVFTMLFVDLFDTTGTLIAVANQAGLVKDNKLPRANRALLSDSIATMAGATLGTSTTTSYIESSAGVGAGGRTGLTSVMTSALFLVALFFSPLLTVVNAYVTAPALIIVGLMMAKGLGEIDWSKVEIALPAFIVVIAMPLTYSIANGIALGLFLYPLTMTFKGKAKEVSPAMWVLMAAFLAFFIWGID